jgi:hypothetical protein
MKFTVSFITVLLLTTLGTIDAAESTRGSPIEIRHFLPDTPVCRALRPVSVSAEIFNLGDTEAEITATLLLPPGVRVLRSNAARDSRWQCGSFQGWKRASCLTSRSQSLRPRNC